MDLGSCVRHDEVRGAGESRDVLPAGGRPFSGLLKTTCLIVLSHPRPTETGGS